jgi:hypothetical protein
LPERVKRRSDYIIVLTGRLRVDVNARLILRRPRTLEGIALAEATAHYAEAEQRPAAFKRALEESWSTIGPAHREEGGGFRRRSQGQRGQSSCRQYDR